MTGPTASLPAIDQLLLTARALVAHDPAVVPRTLVARLKEGLEALAAGTLDPGRDVAGDELHALRLALEAAADPAGALWLLRMRETGTHPQAWFAEDLVPRRAWLGASGVHVGRFGLALQVAQRTGAGREAFADPELPDPGSLARAVLRAAGPDAGLEALAGALLDDAERRRRDALDAPDRAAHLERLFDAIPPAHAAAVLGGALGLAGVARQASVLEARLPVPLLAAAADLDGRQWAEHRADPGRAELLVEQQWLYPRALLPALRGEGPG